MQRRLALWILTGTFILAGVAWGGYWFLIGRFYTSTEDAYVGGNLMPLCMQTMGTCIEIYSDVPHPVTAGEPLVRLDPSDAQIRYRYSLQQLALATQSVATLLAQKEMAQATSEARLAEKLRAQLDYDHRKALLNTGAIPLEDYEHAEAALAVAEATEVESQRALKSIEVQIAPLPPKEHPKILSAATEVRAAYLNLKRTTLVSPTDGIIAQRSVQLGETVQATQPVMSVVPLDSVWVDANFKETQLEGVRVGQKVDVWSDLYGRDVRYQGTVIGIAPGTGAVFSVLPPQNATGNWIKIVQRLPVRIALDASEVARFPLYLGLSMHISIDIHDQSGSRLNETSPERVIAVTEVYPLDLETADAAIHTIVEQFLGT